MQSINKRLEYLFSSTKGLILVAISLMAFTVALFGMLSGPMAEMGVREVVVRIFKMDMVQAEREGRMIILYHSLAMAMIAIEVYMVTDLVKMKSFFKTATRMLVTVGYMLVLFFGMAFAYWGHNWIFHGVFMLGLSLIFFAGVLLTVALWPWNKEYYQPDKDYAHTKKGVDVERMAFFATALTTVLSALFGAIPGSYSGNGFLTFLAEDVIRLPDKSVLQYMVIGHLHIMLALIAIMITMILGRWLNFKGILHKIAMPLMILGTIVLNIGVWGVATPFEPIAHMIIYVGATPAMLAALMLVIFTWDKLIKEGKPAEGKYKFGKKMRALLRDPLRFGPMWQMVFMNFTTSFLGIFMAVRLEEIFRVWPAREERIELTGHWHVLASIVATIILLYFGDMVGFKGKLRQWYGWLIIILSDIAFGAVTIFEMKRLFINEATQQPLVNNLMLAIDFGLGMLLVLVAMLLIWRLQDLFKKKGRWSAEVEQELNKEVYK
jgi:hypothetical protein